MTGWLLAHLLLNHFPVVLAVVGAVGALVGWLTRRRGPSHFGALSLALGGALTLLTYLTGWLGLAGAGTSPGIDPSTIAAHVAAARWGLLAGGAAAVPAVAWLRRGGRGWLTATAVVGLLAAAALGWTAWEGGKIVHAAPPAAEFRGPPVRTP